MNKWIEHNKKVFGVKIVELKLIIESQIRTGGKSDEFTSNMLIALQSGRKITPKMEDAINSIVKRNTPEEMSKRDEWVEKVVTKMMMVKEMISDTNWTSGYKGGSYNFIDSIINQAKSRKTLSKKQMEAINNMYHRVKKNIKKNENKS